MALIPTLEAPGILITVAELMLEIYLYSSRRGWFGRLLTPGQRSEFLAKRGEGCFEYAGGGVNCTHKKAELSIAANAMGISC